MCTYPLQPICTFSCTSVFFSLIFIIHSILYCTFYLIAHPTLYFTLYFIICSLFHSHLYLYIYILLCYVSLFYCLCYFYFIIIILFFLHCPLSRPVPTYISLLIIPCMIVYVTNNKEPWTLIMPIWCFEQKIQMIEIFIHVDFMHNKTKK